MSDETLVKGPSKARAVTPGRTRVMVSLTDVHHAKLGELALRESEVFPREINEFLSILIEKNFTKLVGGAE